MKKIVISIEDYEALTQPIISRYKQAETSQEYFLTELPNERRWGDNVIR